MHFKLRNICLLSIFTLLIVASCEYSLKHAVQEQLSIPAPEFEILTKNASYSFVTITFDDPSADIYYGIDSTSFPNKYSTSTTTEVIDGTPYTGVWIRRNKRLYAFAKKNQTRVSRTGVLEVD